MSVINTGLTEKGIRANFQESFDATQTYHMDLATRIPSDASSESYRWLGSAPQMREWGTGRLAKGLRSESYDIENQEYEATIEVDQKEIEDDQLGSISMRVRELAEYAATHKDYLIEQLLINGASSGFEGYDGLPFFSDSHVSGDSGSQSNLLTYTATDPDDPTVTEFRKALTQAIAKMVAFKDDRGNPKRIRPDGFVIVTPPTMMFTALEAIGAELIENTTNIVRNIARVISLPGLTDASKWYLLKTNAQVRPFIFQDRVPVSFNALADNSEHAFKTGKYLYGARARYAMSYGYWQYAVSTDFTS